MDTFIESHQLRTLMNINRRSFITGVASGALAGALGTFGFIKKPKYDSAKEERRPNLVIFLADDMRWDAIGAAGNRIIHTPNLDALAADGTLFTNNFVTTSICPTSRASILTGQYARRHKIWDFNTPLSHEQFRLSYPSLLRQAGYQTAFIGKWGIGGSLPHSEFDYWRGYAGQGYYFDPTGKRKEHLTDLLSHQAADFLETVNSNKPFCLSFSCKAPHVEERNPADPFKPQSKFAHLYEKITIPRPPTATEEHFERLPAFLRDSEGRELWKQQFSNYELYQHSVKQYYRLITGLDEAVGNIVSILKKEGLYDKTCFIFTSDNGYFLGEHGLAGKWWGYEESIRTPLIIKPVEKPAIQRISAMTLNIDLYPTLLELAGLPIPELAQGTSLVPIFAGVSNNTRNEWFYEHLLEHPTIAESEGIRTDRYKYLRYIDEQEDVEFLFDLYNDPFEENNLVGQAEYEHLLQLKRKKISQMRIDLA